MFKAARRWFWIAPIVLGVIFVGGGIFMIVAGAKARDYVEDALARENITTSPDASIPNEPVDDARTAESQADVIEKHVLEITGGKTYAELSQDDPNRAVVLQSVTLRTALSVSVMGFGVSYLVIGMGGFMIIAGVAFAAFMAPTVYYAARIAEQLEQSQT